VTKDSAFNQGIGGDFYEFLFNKHSTGFGNEDESAIGQLTERLEENKKNAYMLVYIRETEREAIIKD
jgi:hypothetical protein